MLALYEARAEVPSNTAQKRDKSTAFHDARTEKIKNLAH